MTESKPQYVTRPCTSSEIPRIARIQYAAFNDPNNSTPDEISILLHEEETPSAPNQELSYDQRIEKSESRTEELFEKVPSKYTVVGVYEVPSSSSSPSPSSSVNNVGDVGETLCGFAVWQFISPASTPETPVTDEAEKSDPTLFNRFFAKMNRTRETTMAGKSYWFLKLLCIDPNYQRRGLGTLLVNWGVDKANEEGIDAWLESSPMGKGAYLKAGFKMLGTDRLEEKKAERGYVEWPYMIHEYKSTLQH